MKNGMTRSEAGKLGYEKSKEKLKSRCMEIKERYDKNPKACKYCGENIPYVKRSVSFCNHSCAASFNNIGIRRNGVERPKCVSCGNQVSGSRSKYCSQRCQFDYQWEKNKKKIENGEYRRSWSGNKVLFRYCVESRGRKCERCNMDTWLGNKIPLNVHHKDGDATNNVPSNLELLCLNCHGLTDNFGNNNKKGTRCYRRKKLAA